jgi:hypothetical protein
VLLLISELTSYGLERNSFSSILTSITIFYGQKKIMDEEEFAEIDALLYANKKNESDWSSGSEDARSDDENVTDLQPGIRSFGFVGASTPQRKSGKTPMTVPCFANVQGPSHKFSVDNSQVSMRE